jgi:putative Mn2+ efflux pump MntP
MLTCLSKSLAGNYGDDVVALILVAVSLGLSNFAAAIGIGISGTSARTRLKVGIIFGLFETAMPIAGLALGHGLAQSLGHSARWLSAGLLIATGVWAIAQAVRGDRQAAPALDGQRSGRLVITGLAISVDNLAVGFALSAFHVNLAVAAVTIGGISVALSLIGLESGAQIGTRSGQRGELLGGLVLIAVGAAIAAGLI